MKFINHDKSVFFSTLRSRVNQYFKDKNITRYGNQEIVIKSILLLGIYLGCYFSILFVPWPAMWLLPFVFLMGISKAGIGMNVMHDALHGSFSNKNFVNQLMGSSIYLLGSNASVWKIQHNVLHHTYTNIHGKDEDIANKAVIRLSRQAPLKGFHAYQHIYAFFLYGFLSLHRMVDEFFKLLNYHKTGILKRQRKSAKQEFLRLVSFKLIYLFFMLVLPVLITPLLWWQVLIGFTLMHMVAGFILATIFQFAHIVEGAAQPIPNAEGNIENEWAIHQLRTTANFARNSRILNWYIGGLNFQIEHHLFPNISHVHYREISKIVEQTAAEFKLPYNVKPTVGDAFMSHLRILRQLGSPLPKVKA
jgi:linoleoyl-CoA desaturase